MSARDKGVARIRQVTIIGTGLLGGSIGLGLRGAGYRGRLVGVGRRLETVQRARARGCVDEALALDDLPRALAQSQMVVLATPISTFPDLLRRIAAADHAALVITDVASTKSQVLQAARAILPQPGRFVGSHPMAGSEQHGPEAAVADLFRGKPCIVTPMAGTQPLALRAVVDLWRLLGMRVLRMTPARHDQQVAAVSHLPHAVAALLVRLAQRRGGLEVASTGFRDTTRVASGDPQVWLDIFTTNRQAQIRMIDQFIVEMLRLRRLLQGGQDRQLYRLLEQCKQARDQWMRERQGPAGGGRSESEGVES